MSSPADAENTRWWITPLWATLRQLRALSQQQPLQMCLANPAWCTQLASVTVVRSHLHQYAPDFEASWVIHTLRYALGEADC
jgi:hypothetical protein